MLMLARSVPDSQITWNLASVTYEAFTVSMFIGIWLEITWRTSKIRHLFGMVPSRKPLTTWHYLSFALEKSLCSNDIFQLKLSTSFNQITRKISKKWNIMKPRLSLLFLGKYFVWTMVYPGLSFSTIFCKAAIER